MRDVPMKLEPYVGEPDIQRLFAAFRRQKVDRVPNLEALIEDTHVERLLGRFAGNTLSLGSDPAKGVAEGEGARPMMPGDYIELCRIIGQDTTLVEATWTPFKKRRADGSVGQISDRSIKNRADFRQHVILPSEDDIEGKAAYVREYRKALDASGTRIGLGMTFAAFFQTLYEFVIGLEDAMKMVYEDRDLMEELLDISAEWCGKLCDAGVKNGADFVWVGDDVAFKTGLFLPPEIMREMWLPRLARIIAPAKRAGKPVMFHSDGNVVDLVPMLLDVGIDCVQPMDPYGVDYREMKKRFGGRVCLAGNIDIEFPLAHGTTADVEKDVREHLEALMPGGGYICGSSHSIVNYIPHENFVAMLNAIHRHGVYGDRAWAGVQVARHEAQPEKMPLASREAACLDQIESPVLKRIFTMVYRGRQKEMRASIEAALSEKVDPMRILGDALTPAIKAVGANFSSGDMFLPELLMASGAMQEAMKVLTPLLKGAAGKPRKAKVLLGTIKGDLHDIGKNIVRALLEGNGFEVIDIGIDNAPEEFVEAARGCAPDVIGYSGLLTTTLGGMPDQIEALKKAGLRERTITIVGGAPVTRDFAERNGVDLFGKDANEGVLAIEAELVRRADRKGARPIEGPRQS
jgi:methylmalonyl-CoA mutase cobalamin-binding domain/chain